MPTLTEWTEILQIIQAVVTIVFTIGLAIYALLFAKEFRETIRARYLSGMQFVIGLIGTEKHADHRRWVYQELEQAAKPLVDKDAERVRAICRDYDHVGLLCRQRLLPINIVTEAYGRNIVDMWNLLEPVITEWRKTIGDPDYYAEFEWLVHRARETEKRLAKMPHRK